MKDEDTNKDFFFSLSLSCRSLLFFLLLLLLKFFSSSIRMMWTMKCFSRETDREILSDFIRLGQTWWWSIISSHQLFFLFSLAFFSFFFFRQPPRTCPPRQKTFWKKGKNQEKVRHVKRVALITLYPFYNTISNTYTHEVVVLWFE